MVCEVAQVPGTSRGQQNNQQAKSNRKVSDPQPPLDAVIAPRFGRIGQVSNWAGSRHDSVILISRRQECQSQQCCWAMSGREGQILYPLAFTKASALARISLTSAGEAASV